MNIKVGAYVMAYLHLSESSKLILLVLVHHVFKESCTKLMTLSLSYVCGFRYIFLLSSIWSVTKFDSAFAAI